MGKTRALDLRKLRNALGNFATGVTIVTTQDSKNPDGYVGTTASSFNSVSLDPPLILWSVDKQARSLASYKQGEYFAVNVLSADQVSLANHFACQQNNKFADIEYELGIGGVPLFKGCAARFQCKTRYRYEGGDHIIIVGEILAFDTTDRDALLFHRGKYVVSEYHPFNSIYGNKTKSANDNFTDDYLHYLIGRSFAQLMQKLNTMLLRQGLNEREYRILASLSGRDGCEFSVLCHYAVLAKEDVMVGLEDLEKRRLVLIKKTRIKRSVVYS